MYRCDNYYIVLQEAEVELAQTVAQMRTEENLRRPNCSESKENLMQSHWPGALSELAISLYYDLEWEGVYYEGKDWRNRGNDVKGLEIKSSFRYDNLTLDMADPELFPDTPFIFVKLSKLPNPGSYGATLKGWIYGREALEHGEIRRNYRKNKDYYLIHHSYFRDMDDLPPVHLKPVMPMLKPQTILEFAEFIEDELARWASEGCSTSFKFRNFNVNSLSMEALNNGNLRIYFSQDGMVSFGLASLRKTLFESVSVASPNFRNEVVEVLTKFNNCFSQK